MTGMNDTERLVLEGENPLSILSDPLSFSADYDSSGRSFVNRDCGIANCVWGGYFLGPTGQAPTGAAGLVQEPDHRQNHRQWYYRETYHHETGRILRRTAAIAMTPAQHDPLIHSQT